MKRMSGSVDMSAVRVGVRRAYIVPRLRRQFAALAAMLGMASAAHGFETRQAVPYGPLPAQIGDLYLPGSTAPHRPAVVAIHGGGWVEGSRVGSAGVAKLLAALGAVVFNIDYRLADKADPATRWPAQLVDAQLAVRFLRAHAAEYGIDTNRIGAIGDSAGAQLAVFLGVLPRIVEGDMASLYSAERPDVAAVVDQYGPMDIPGMGLYAGPSIEALFGTREVPGTQLLTASPLPSIAHRDAPVYIIHGEADQVVPFQQIPPARGCAARA